MSGDDMIKEKDIIASISDNQNEQVLKDDVNVNVSDSSVPVSDKSDTPAETVAPKKGKKRGRKPKSHALKNGNPTSQVNPDTSNQSSKRHSSRLSRRSNNTVEMSLKDSPVILEADNNSKLKVDGTIQNGGIKEFVEPEPAEPKPLYTGLPLESYPSTKIKKDYLWPTRGPGKRGRYSNKEKEVFESFKPTEEETEFEEQYNKSLKTEISETLTASSDIRDPLRSKRDNKQSIQNEHKATPKQDNSRHSDEYVSPMRPTKRIKVISPKKSSSTALVPSTSSNKGDDKVDDSTIDNDDYCSTCGGSGIFICCESCPKSFHFICCDPPLEEVPEENWHCNECSYKFTKVKPQWNLVGIFGQLLNQMESLNPLSFQLPVNFRENVFVGVTTGGSGDYSDSSFKSEMTRSQANGSQITGYNWNQDLEVDTLYRKNGTPYLCHFCGLSGQNHKTLVHCDYCPLVWHVDCLDEPLCSPKTIGTKWRCPNHVESLIPKGFNFRQFKDSAVIDVSLHNQFLKIAYMNNILIKHEDQPYFKDGRHPSLQEYLHYQSQDFKSYNEDFVETPKIEDLDEFAKASHIRPDYFQTMSKSNGIGSRLSSKLTKIIKLTDRKAETGSCIYRVPEKLIILDFMSKVKDNHLSVKQDLVDFVEEYDNRSRLEVNQDEKTIVDGLLEVKNSELPRPNKLDFGNLVKAAMLKCKEEEHEAPQSKLTDSEISDLLKIKKLMELKGEEALLQFLQS